MTFLCLKDWWKVKSSLKSCSPLAPRLKSVITVKKNEDVIDENTHGLFLSSIDENIHPSKMVDILGDKALADQITQAAVALYTKARDFAAEKGIIIADTKFEFGLDENNNLVVVDEVLTPGK